MTLAKAACIETLFTELPFYDRFKAAKDAGFAHVEFWGWPDKDPGKVADAARTANITICGFNGDADFSLVDPTHTEKYLAYLRQSLEFAKKVGAPSVTIHSNALGEGGLVVNHYDHLSPTVKLCSMHATLLKCLPLADEYGVNLNLEALNITTDHIGNFLATTEMGGELCRLIGHPRLKILYDVYHMQLNEGSICDNISKYVREIGHIHVADAPGRHEPGTGEINYPNVLAHLEAAGYRGIVGYELFPKTDTATAVRAIMA